MRILQWWLSLCAAVAVVIIPRQTTAQSRFMETYPAHAEMLAEATKNVALTGTCRTNDYDGAITFLKLGEFDQFALREFHADETSLPWTNKVESYSPDWVFALETPVAQSEWQWKGVAFLNALDPEDAHVYRFRRWHKCNMFTCATYSVYGASVLDVMRSPAFQIVREGPGTVEGTYLVEYTGPAPMAWLDDSEVCRAGRLVFDENQDWALREFDILTESVRNEFWQYYQGRVSPADWDSRGILPRRISIRAGRPTQGAHTGLGSVEWDGTEVFTEVQVESVMLGEVKEMDFMPASYGFPDHLVRAADDRSQPVPVFWLVVIGGNLVLLIWWTLNRWHGRAR